MLEKLKHEIQYEKLTVSFSIEGRDQNGVKKFSQLSTTASRPFTVDDDNKSRQWWTPEEMPIVKALMAKQVVSTTYKDAVMRGVMTSTTASSELKHILDGIDKDIAKRIEAIENAD